MPKGLYSQTFCLLTNGEMVISEIRSALIDGGFDVVKNKVASPTAWISGPSVVVSYSPEINGYAFVDVVNHAWPDAMGNPKTDFEIFGAWGLGQFGPFTYPGGLLRATQNCWSSPGAAAAAQSHSGFVRIRLGYSAGLPTSPCLPKGCDPLHELNYLSNLTETLLSKTNAICYFNPNGEVLAERGEFIQILNESKQQQKIPLPLWTNVRLYRVDEEFMLMDSVGNGQLDVSDVEAIFPISRYQPNEVGYYLRNLTHYSLEIRRRMKVEGPIDGPGESNLSWMAELRDSGVVQPPRKVTRLYPQDLKEHINALLPPIGAL